MLTSVVPVLFPLLHDPLRSLPKAPSTKVPTYPGLSRKSSTSVSTRDFLPWSLPPASTPSRSLGLCHPVQYSQGL